MLSRQLEMPVRTRPSFPPDYRPANHLVTEKLTRGIAEELSMVHARSMSLHSPCRRFCSAPVWKTSDR